MLIAIKLIGFMCALFGYILNITDGKRDSYILWIISNTVFIINSFVIGEVIMVLMFSTYLCFCIFGLYREIKFNKLNN